MPEMFSTKMLEEIPVAYCAVLGPPSIVAASAFRSLERIVPLKGNRFYGLFYPERGEYQACVALRDGSEARPGLQAGVIPGGWYACATLIGPYLQIIQRVAPTFDEMGKAYERDPARPSVEFYSRHTEIVVMMPVLRRTAIA